MKKLTTKLPLVIDNSIRQGIVPFLVNFTEGVDRKYREAC